MVTFMKKTIPAGEFKAKCLQLMDQVYKQHNSIVITKHGKPVARLVPIENDIKLSKSKDLFGYMSGTVAILSDIVAPIEESWDAEKGNE